MRTSHVASVAVLLALGCTSTQPAAAPVNPPAAAVQAAAPAPIAAAAVELVNAVAAGEYANATIRFTPEMRAQLSPAQLQAAWAQVTGQVGSLQRVGDAQQLTEQGFDIVLVPLTFERGTLRARVVFDRSGSVAGLFFIP